MSDLIILQEQEMWGRLPSMSIDLPQGFVIAGGAIRRWFTGEEQTSDIDLFRVDGKEEYELPIKGLSKKRSTQIQDTYKLGNQTVQVIKRPYDSIENLIESFDYQHCQFSYDGTTIYATKEAIITSVRKHLSLNNVIEGFELDTLRRAFKYCKQGFMPCVGTIQAIGKMLQDSDSILDEQAQLSPSGGRRKVIRFD